MSGKAPDDVPRSPTGRVPQWVLDEAAGKKVEPVPFRGAPNPLLTDATRASRRRGPRRWPRALLGVVALVAVAALVSWGFSQPLPMQAPSGPVAAPGRPPAGVDEAARRADLPVVGPVGTSTSFRFLDHQADGSTPVTWSPCRPIHWVVRPLNAPPGGQQRLESAFARVSEATGITFIADGTTAEGWTEDREAYQPERYGERWAPVLVVWATSREVPDFGVDIAGEAGPSGIGTASGEVVFVSGAVALSSASFAKLGNGKRKAVAEAIVLHELGHLMGLAHVDDRAQLMFPRAQNGRTDYGTGDRAGLTALGRGPCRPDV
jgi:hypothetical protein